MDYLKDKRILLVDDETYYMGSIIDALEAFGAIVTTLTNGTDAIQYMEDSELQPDIIILDIMMPSGSRITTDDEGRSTGIEVYKYIRRELNLNTPIVISSVVTDDEMLSAFPNDDKLKKVQKPYLFEELARCMKALCHW